MAHGSAYGPDAAHQHFPLLNKVGGTIVTSILTRPSRQVLTVLVRWIVSYW